MFVKRFFYASAAILCLSLAYHLGASTASAQKSTWAEVAAAYQTQSVITRFGALGGNLVIMKNGDLYFQNVFYGPGWTNIGNVLVP